MGKEGGANSKRTRQEEGQKRQGKQGRRGRTKRQGREKGNRRRPISGATRCSRGGDVSSVDKREGGREEQRDERKGRQKGHGPRGRRARARARARRGARERDLRIKGEESQQGRRARVVLLWRGRRRGGGCRRADRRGPIRPPAVLMLSPSERDGDDSARRRSRSKGRRKREQKRKRERDEKREAPKSATGEKARRLGTRHQAAPRAKERARRRRGAKGGGAHEKGLGRAAAARAL